MTGGMGDQLQPFGLQTMGAETEQNIHHALRAVAKGETAPVFYQSSCSLTQLVQAASLLAAEGTAAGPGADREIRRVRHHKVKGSGLEGRLAQISCKNITWKVI